MSAMALGEYDKLPVSPAIVLPIGGYTTTAG
jgi:hypothetical protein